MNLRFGYWKKKLSWTFKCDEQKVKKIKEANFSVWFRDPEHTLSDKT